MMAKLMPQVAKAAFGYADSTAHLSVLSIKLTELMALLGSRQGNQIILQGLKQVRWNVDTQIMHLRSDLWMNNTPPVQTSGVNSLQQQLESQTSSTSQSGFQSSLVNTVWEGNDYAYPFVGIHFLSGGQLEVLYDTSTEPVTGSYVINGDKITMAIREGENEIVYFEGYLMHNRISGTVFHVFEGVRKDLGTFEVFHQS